MKEKDKKSELALMKTDIVDVVSTRINDMVGNNKLLLPKDYSANNALMAAWLKLQSTKDKSNRLALSVCTHDSIANALLDMIVQGLTPAKEQCYFVVYGDKLAMLRSYFGDEALLKRVYPGARVYAEPIFKGDSLEYEIIRGKKMITKHTQKFGDVGGLDNIVGGYAIVEPGEGNDPHCEIMTLAQITKAWSRGENWPPRPGKMSAHTDHPEEFVKKTVIARACKRFINTSDDSYLVKAVERQEYLAAESELTEKAEGEKEMIDIKPDQPPPSKDNPNPTGRNHPETKYTPPKGKDPPEAPSSPAARFLDFLEEHKLDPTKARRLAASIRKLKDVRNLGNEDFEEILNEGKAFLVYYREKYKGGQMKLDDPGF